MIQATVMCWDGSTLVPPVRFDAEPWFDNVASPKVIERMSRYVNHSEVVSLETDGLGCVQWICQNYPTPELTHFMSNAAYKSWEIRVHSHDLKRWFAKRKVRNTARTSVDKLLGGEP